MGGVARVAARTEPGSDNGHGNGTRRSRGGGGRSGSIGKTGNDAPGSDEMAKDAAKADGQIVASANKTASDVGKIDDKAIEKFEKGQQERVDAAQKSGEFLVEMGVKTQGQLLQEEIKAEEARTNAEITFFRDEQKLYARDSAE
jgi:hypothetical protein